jgi:hypothetical protein
MTLQPPPTTYTPWQRWLWRTNGRRSIPPPTHHSPKKEESTNCNSDPEWRGNHPNNVYGNTAHIYGPTAPKIWSHTELWREYTTCWTAALRIAANILEEPITLEELRAAVAIGKARKAPGCDGISHVFFKITWEVTKHELLNFMYTMYSDAMITDTQKLGVIVCVPKTLHPFNT